MQHCSMCPKDGSDCVNCGRTQKAHKIRCRYPMYPCTCRRLDGHIREIVWTVPDGDGYYSLDPLKVHDA